MILVSNAHILFILCYSTGYQLPSGEWMNHNGHMAMFLNQIWKDFSHFLMNPKEVRNQNFQILGDMLGIISVEGRKARKTIPKKMDQ